MANEMNRQRQEEQEAVRTTIVGGRPPGCGKSTGSVPRGIEVLVKKAAVDAEFKSLLLSKRGEAAKSIGLELSAAESMMLSAVPAAQLRSIIAATAVPPSHVPAFLGKVAAVMLAALGIVQGGCDESRTAKPAGIRPEDMPSPRDNAAATSRPAEPAEVQPPFVIAGLVMVKPLTRPATQPTEPISAVAGVRPADPARIAGERIDRPRGASRPATEPVEVAGLRAERTEEAPVAGLRADAPTRPATEPTTQPATQPPHNTTVYGLMMDRPQNTVIRGLRADPPPATRPATEPSPPPPLTILGAIADRPMVVKGIRVDRPETPATAPTTSPTTKPTSQPAAQAEPVPEPDFPITIDGIRPDRPKRGE